MLNSSAHNSAITITESASLPFIEGFNEQRKM